MSDTVYVPTFVPRTAASRVERLATLYPLARRPAGGVEQIIEAWHDVLVLWRRRVTQAFRLGAPVARDEIVLQGMRDCHPSCVASGAEGVAWYQPRCCKAEHYCPWCWARNAAKSYKDVLGMMASLPGGGNGHMLYLLSDRYISKADDSANKNLRALLRYRNTVWADTAKAAGALATTRLATLEPRLTRRGRTWVYRNKVLLIYPPGRGPPTELPARAGVTYAAEFSRGHLVTAVAKLSRYPSGLLHCPHGLAKMAARALTARKGLRLRECTGLLRNLK